MGHFLLKKTLLVLVFIIHNDKGLVMATLTQQIPLPASVDGGSASSALSSLVCKGVGFLKLDS